MKDQRSENDYFFVFNLPITHSLRCMQDRIQRNPLKKLFPLRYEKKSLYIDRSYKFFRTCLLFYFHIFSYVYSHNSDKSDYNGRKQ